MKQKINKYDEHTDRLMLVEKIEDTIQASFFMLDNISVKGLD